jgi:hypothetical protein
MALAGSWKARVTATSVAVGTLGWTGALILDVEAVSYRPTM